LNALLVLMGLLLLSYVGSFLVGGRTIRGFGLPSGAEYVVLGFVLGPYVLDLLSRALVQSFDPIAEVALGWLALVIGLDYGSARDGRSAKGTRVVGGILVAIVTGTIVAAAVWFVLRRLTQFRGIDAVLVAGGVAAACSETTRHAVRWVVERHRASGPVADLVADLAASDDLAPLLVTGVLFALRTRATLPWAASLPHGELWGWAALTLALGAVLGALAAVLLGRDFRRDESWGVLLGMSLLAVGICARLGLSAICALFAMGGTIALVSTHRGAIRELVAPTERAVLHPALLLAGAHVDLRAPALPFVVLFALSARAVAKLLVGFCVQAVSPPARAAGPMFGMGLMSSGALAMTIGLAFALRFPGDIGNTVLTTAVAATLLGAFIGPTALRATLRQAGEVDTTPAGTETAEVPS
jgi:hypothetical protein